MLGVMQPSVTAFCMYRIRRTELLLN